VSGPPPSEVGEASDEIHEDYPDRQSAPIFQPRPRGTASPWSPPASPAPPDDRPVYAAGEQDDDGYYYDDEDIQGADDQGAFPQDPRGRFFPAADPDRHRQQAPGPGPAYPDGFDEDGYDDEEREFEDDYFGADSGGFSVVDQPAQDVRGEPARDVRGEPARDVRGEPVRDARGEPVRDVRDRPTRDVRGVPPKDVRDVPPRQSPWETAAQGGWGTPAQGYPTQRPSETPLPMSSAFGATPTTNPTYPARPSTDLVMLPRPPRSRSPLLAILLIVAVAVVGGGLAALVAFAAARPDHGSTPGPSVSATPSAGGTAAARTAPRNLTIRDNATSVTLTWTDPTTGTVPFIVAGGQQGAMGQLQSLTAGTTTYTINGLNPHLDYCFTVAAVYDTQTVALSQLACTRRGTASPKR
jgi:hypothetical protein